MGRPLLSLWRWLVPPVLAVPALAVFAIVNPVFAAVLLLLLAVVGGLPPCRMIRRLTAAVRRFRTRAGRHVRLHYDPAVTVRCHLPALVRQCEADLERLAAWFGRPPGGRPTVFLFTDSSAVARVFGPQCGGAALPVVSAIAVAADESLRESVRHELAHLFAAKWNFRPPPLLAEGLAVWLQGTQQGEPIDLMAWPWVTEPGLGLRKLLHPGSFFAEPNLWACYLLAGSFTGSLLRHHGKSAYRRLYARAKWSNFATEFQRCLGLSFEQAERRWRHEMFIGGPLGRPAGPAESPWAAAPEGVPEMDRDSRA